jgi:hypothetical protein
MDFQQNTFRIVRVIRAKRCRMSRTFVRLAVGISITTTLCGAVFAQTYPGGTPTTTAPNGTYTSPSGGYSSSTGIGIGVGAAAGAGVLYLVLRHRGLVSGCVQQAKDGLSFLDDKNKRTYSLMPGDADVKSGERVELKGKKVKDDNGTQIFEAKKLVKNLGDCNSLSAAASSHADSR